jgi:hypothetical protein
VKNVLNAVILSSEPGARYAPTQKILLNHALMRTRRIRVSTSPQPVGAAAIDGRADAAISVGDKKTAPLQECGFSYC